MNETLELLNELHRAGVEMVAEGGLLRWKAPAGVMTTKRRQKIRERRPEIVAYLSAKSRNACSQSSLEALELRGDLIAYYNRELESLELSGVPSIDAERIARAKTEASPMCQKWRGLAI